MAGRAFYIDDVRNSSFFFFYSIEFESIQLVPGEDVVVSDVAPPVERIDDEESEGE